MWSSSYRYLHWYRLDILTLDLVLKVLVKNGIGPTLQGVPNVLLPFLL